MDLKQRSIEFLFSLVLSLILGKILIALLRKESIGQNVSEYGPESHLAKQGTPTMGGVIIVLALVISSFVFLTWSKELGLVMLSTLGFGLVGFIDDFLMLAMKKAEGLTPRQKIIMQLILAVVLTFLIKVYLPDVYGYYRVPFLKDLVYLPRFSYFLYPLVLIGTVNATNLTDGLDGLLSSVTLAVLGFLYIAVRPMGQLGTFVILLAAAITGFLAYNTNKASVFMGDTGSMTIGGAVAILSILTGNVFYLPIFGIVYVIEAGSVILQVLSVKLRNGKRLFLMTPIHHGYEKKGYNEQKIVTNFTILTLIGVLIALII